MTGTDSQNESMLARVLAAPVLALALVLAAVTPAPARADQAVLERAGSLLDRGQAKAALEQLAPLETELAGEPAFDYLFGLALLETGEPGRAVFALQRVVSTEPANAGARLDLARAYYELGSYLEAEREFEYLLDQNPPPAARRAIREYLDLIRSRTGQLKLSKEFNLRLGGGYDSNANSATTVDRFLGFTLVPQSRETASPFAEIHASGRLVKPLRPGLLLDTRLSLGQRNNPDASFVDSTVATAGIGIRSVSAGSSKSLGIEAHRLNIDSELNSEGAALVGNWSVEPRRNLRLGVFARAGVLRYGDDLKIKDVDQYVFGASVNWLLGPDRRGSLGATLLYGIDDAVEATSRYSRDLYGIRINAGWALSESVRLTFSTGYMAADYDRIFFEQEFDNPREDTLAQASLRLDWSISRKWLLRHLVAYSRNETDVDIFEYERVVTSLTLQRQWR